MRKIAAVCLCAGLGVLSFTIPLSGQKHHPHHHRVKLKTIPAAFRINLTQLPSSPVVLAPPVPTVTPLEYAEWSRVAVCEEGGWIGYAGPAYPDSLGISATNWYGNGGGSDLSPAAQIIVAERIQTNPPDQHGCAPW